MNRHRQRLVDDMKSKLQGDVLFQVQRDGDEVLLRPMRDTEIVHLEGGEEFVTGQLRVNPFKDGSQLKRVPIDGNRRQG